MKGATFIRHGLQYFESGMKVLEVGPDRQTSIKKAVDDKIGIDNYEYFYADINDDYVKKVVDNFWDMRTTIVDTEDYSHQVKMSDENTFLVKDNTFDIIFSSDTIEHVRMPWLWIKDMVRIVKVGGYVIHKAPKVNTGFHESPVDCWRIYPDGLRALYEYVGLTVLGIPTGEKGNNNLDTVIIGTKEK